MAAGAPIVGLRLPLAAAYRGEDEAPLGAGEVRCKSADPIGGQRQHRQWPFGVLASSSWKFARRGRHVENRCNDLRAWLAQSGGCG